MRALESNTLQKKLKNSQDSKSIITNLYRIQANDSILCQCFSFGFIDFTLKGKSLLDFINLFSANKYKKMIK